MIVEKAYLETFQPMSRIYAIFLQACVSLRDMWMWMFVCLCVCFPMRELFSLFSIKIYRILQLHYYSRIIVSESVWGGDWTVGVVLVCFAVCTRFCMVHYNIFSSQLLVGISCFAGASSSLSSYVFQITFMRHVAAPQRFRCVLWLNGVLPWS